MKTCKYPEYLSLPLQLVKTFIQKHFKPSDHTIMKLLLFFFSYLLTLCAYAAELGVITSDQLEVFQSTNNALVIDIRTLQEWNKTGTIPSSSKIEYFDTEGNYNTRAWLAKLEQLKKSTDQPIVLVCRSGHRSETVGQQLTKQLGMENVYHLKGGIMSWINSGKELDKTCPNNQLACK